MTNYRINRLRINTWRLYQSFWIKLLDSNSISWLKDRWPFFVKENSHLLMNSRERERVLISYMCVTWQIWSVVELEVVLQLPQVTLFIYWPTGAELHPCSPLHGSTLKFQLLPSVSPMSLKACTTGISISKICNHLVLELKDIANIDHVCITYFHLQVID